MVDAAGAKDPRREIFGFHGEGPDFADCAYRSCHCNSPCATARTMAMTDKQKARACYYAAAAIVIVLLLVILYMWHQHAVKHTGETMYIHKNRAYGAPGNPQHYEYGDYLKARAAQGGPAHGRRAHDGHRGHDHGAGGVSHVDFDHNHGYHSQHADDGLGERFSSREGMMNTAHWDQAGTYQHTGMTWGLPVGEGRVNYSGFSKESFGGHEGMSVGAHWDTEGTYGHTASTLPTFGLSGYYEDVPTASWA